MASEYSSLNLNREQLPAVIRQFMSERSFSMERRSLKPGCERYEFGKPGVQFATVDLYYREDGTTTVNYKVGKNQALGEELAEVLKATIPVDACENVNLVLEGVFSENIELAVAGLDTEAFLIIEQQEKNKKVWLVKSKAHGDFVRVTLHTGTHTLQIQGRPLSSYRALIYCLTQSLDRNALEKVLLCRDENRSEIVNTSVAKSALQQIFGSTFSKLDDFVVNNLVSGLCIKLAAPELPDYSMLLFPELRSLEAALKKLLRQQGVEFRKGEGFGKVFQVTPDGMVQIVNGAVAEKLRPVLEKAYADFHRHRHTLFHVNNVIRTSRVVDTLAELNALSSEIQEDIKKIYEVL